MQKEDVPPEYLWEDGEGLEAWWEKVEARRSDGRQDSPPPARSDDSDSDGEPGEHQTPGMAENDLARFLKQG